MTPVTPRFRTSSGWGLSSEERLTAGTRRVPSERAQERPQPLFMEHKANPRSKPSLAIGERVEGYPCE